MSWKAISYYVNEYGICPGAEPIPVGKTYDGWLIVAVSVQDFPDETSATDWAYEHDYEDDTTDKTLWLVIL